MNIDIRSRAALKSIPRPSVPITQPWELSIGRLIGRLPMVPAIATRLLRRLDQYGRVVITPERLGFDDKTVRWSKIIEIRTHPVQVPPQVVVEREIDRLRKMLPPIPGRKFVVTLAARRLLSMVWAWRDVWSGGSPVRSLPCEIIYKTWLGGRARLPAGLVAAAVLAVIPEATESIVATAQAQRIPVRAVAEGIAQSW